MDRFVLCAVWALLTGQADPVPPADPPAQAGTLDRDVEVRCGPSESYPVTSRLVKGSTVRILKEANGYLGIEPPPGSFSWVHDRLVRPATDGLLYIEAREGAPIRVGIQRDRPPSDVVATLLKRGTIVTTVGPFLMVKSESAPESGKWWPIVPLDELRWIPRDAVPHRSAVELVSASVPAAAPSAPPDGWAQAEAAERSGDLPRAKQLYAALVGATTDHDLQIRCYNRIAFLQNGNQGSAPTGYQGGRPAEATTGEFRPVPTPVAVVPPPAGPIQAASSTARPASQTTGPGWLQRSPVWIDRRETFVLTDGPGKAQLYVLHPPEVNLEPFVNRSVLLTGTIMYRADLRTNVIEVAQVMQAR